MTMRRGFWAWRPVERGTAMTDTRFPAPDAQIRLMLARRHDIAQRAIADLIARRKAAPVGAVA